MRESVGGIGKRKIGFNYRNAWEGFVVCDCTVLEMDLF